MVIKVDRRVYDKRGQRWRIKTPFDTVLAASAKRLLRIGKQRKRINVAMTTHKLDETAAGVFIISATPFSEDGARVPAADTNRHCRRGSRPAADRFPKLFEPA